MRNLHIENDGPNGDGCDPESCKDVLIEGCYFDTGDDCIAIKAGRNNDGRRWNTPSENIIVRNCRMKNGHGGVVIGSEMSGGFRNLFVENCIMDSPELDRVIRIKTNSCRGGVIENIFVRDVTVGRCGESVLKINLDYEPNETAGRGHLPTVRNVYMERVNCEESRYGVMITALDDVMNVYNINVTDCRFNGVTSGGNNITGLTRDIRLANLYINGKLCTEYQPCSQAMAVSEMARNPESWMLDFAKRPKWSYTMGVELEAFLDLYERYGDEALRDYAISFADTMVNADGAIATYRPTDYNIDHIKTGVLLMRVYDLTGEEKYLKAVRNLRSQLKDHPRTSEGGFWHKKIYPHQMWLDGIYMGSPFLAMYISKFEGGDAKAYDDVVKQFKLAAKHTWDKSTGLYRHGWDESRSQAWADPKTGRSQHAWGRAMGWFFMALVDVMDYLPESHAGRKDLLKIMRKVADGVVKYQDGETGLWYQVMDTPGKEGNYLEATCSAMFSYSLLKAARMGYLDEKYRQAGEKAYRGILDNFIRKDPDGTISLTRCCVVSGLGGDSRRDGSFDYYISEPIRDNDAKGVGPFIKAGLEMER